MNINLSNLMKLINIPQITSLKTMSITLVILFFATGILPQFSLAFVAVAYYTFALICAKIRIPFIFALTVFLIIASHLNTAAVPFLAIAGLVGGPRVIKDTLIKTRIEATATFRRMRNLYLLTRDAYQLRAKQIEDNKSTTPYTIWACTIIAIYPIFTHYTFQGMIALPATFGLWLGHFFVADQRAIDLSTEIMRNFVFYFRKITFYVMLASLFTLFFLSIKMCWRNIRWRVTNPRSRIYMLFEIAMLTGILIHFSNILGEREGSHWTNLPWPGNTNEQWAENWSAAYFGSLVRSIERGFAGILGTPFFNKIPVVKTIPFLPDISPTSDLAQAILFLQFIALAVMAAELYVHRSEKNEGTRKKGGDKDA